MSAASDLLDRAPRSTVRAVERVLQAGKNTTQEALITRMLNALADAVPHMSPHAAGDAVGEASGYNVLLRILEQPWWRFHQCRFGAVHFGRSGNSRFDPPQGPQGTYSVLYAATDVHGAFIETLGRVTGQNRVDMQTLRDICLALLETARPLNLVDLTGAGLARIGADARLCTMDDYALCGRWALALWGHPQQPDGLYYRARHDQQRLSLALFDRDEIVNAMHDYAHGPLADPKHATLLGDILDMYRFQLIP